MRQPQTRTEVIICYIGYGFYLIYEKYQQFLQWYLGPDKYDERIQKQIQDYIDKWSH